MALLFALAKSVLADGQKPGFCLASFCGEACLGKGLASGCDEDVSLVHPLELVLADVILDANGLALACTQGAICRIC